MRIIFNRFESRPRIAVELLDGPGQGQIQLLWDSGPHSGSLICNRAEKCDSVDFVIHAIEQISAEPIEAKPPRGRDVLWAARQAVNIVFGAEAQLRIPGESPAPVT